MKIHRALFGLALRLGAGLAVAGGSLVLLAYQAPQVTFRAGVDLVDVEVSVLDKNRLPVRGLTANDFTVLEEGSPRPVVAFTAVDLQKNRHQTPHMVISDNGSVITSVMVFLRRRA